MTGRIRTLLWLAIFSTTLYFADHWLPLLTSLLGILLTIATHEDYK